MNYISDRITVDDALCNGNPTIRGLRITVQTILEFLLNGTSEDEILHQYPSLEQADIEACKSFAIKLMNKNFTVKYTAA